MKANTWFSKWLNRAYKTLAILLVTLAVLISAIRLLIPYGDGFRVTVQDYLNEQYQGEIRIGGLNTDWGKSGPVLVAEDVALLESEGLSVKIGAIDLRINFWATITQRKLITSYFTLKDSVIKFDETLFESEQNSNEDSLVSNLSDFFFQQIHHFKVNNAQVFLTDIHNNQHQLGIERLSWNNKGDRHQAVGDFIIQGVSTNTAKFTLDITGQTLSEVNGVLYTHGANLNMSPLIARTLNIESQYFNTDINFDAWVNLKNGKPETMQVDVSRSALSWNVTNQQQELVLLPGQLLWKKAVNPVSTSVLTGLEGSLTSSQLQLNLDQKISQPFTISAEFSPEKINAYLSTLDLTQLSAVASAFVDNNELQRTLKTLSPSGKLNDIHINFDLNEGLQASSALADANWSATESIPGIAGLNAEIAVANNKLALSIQSQSNAGPLALDFAHHFSRPIPYNELSAQVELSWFDNGWQLIAGDIALSSDELSLSGDLVFEDFEGEDSPYMGLSVYVKDADASKTQYYLPLSIMDDDLVEYLNESIISGELASTRVILNGPVKNFPFIDNSGIFVANGDLKNAQYQFDPDWAPIHALDANLDFTNDGMLITVNSSDLTGLNAKGTTARIDSFSGDNVLVVDAPVVASPANLKSLMLQSPLANSVGTVLEQLNVHKDVEGDFKLTLPFDDVDATVAQGRIALVDNIIDLKAPQMHFEQVNGEVFFVNDDIKYPEVLVTWRNLPLALSGQAFDTENFYQAQIAMKGQWDKDTWQDQLPENMVEYAQGEVEWQGELDLFFPDQEGFSYTLNLHSDLNNTELKLPAPYAKTATQSVALKVDVKGNDNQSTIMASMGEKLEFYGQLEHQEVYFSRAHLVLGDDKMLLPMDGFHITASLGDIDYKPWQDFVFDVIASLPENDDSPPIIDIPERIRGNVSNLSVWGQELKAVSFNLLNKSDWWLLQFNADKARAQVKIHHNLVQYGVDIDADFVHLDDDFIFEESDNNDEFNRQLFNNMVPLTVNCQSCRFQYLDLGKLEANVTLDENQITLDKFYTQRNDTKIEATGNWQYNERGTNVTNIAGNISTNDLHHEVTLFNYESIVRDSGLKAEFSLNWQGSPQDFYVDTLNGDFHLALDDGYLADVDDKGARLLTIFSMRSLVRKLSLDFRDIFSNGMFYEDIKGDFVIENGVVKTDNVKMNGAAGDVSVAGQTDLTNETLDYKMSFTPKVTSSIPVIVAWMVNPVAGLATLAVDQMIHSAEVIANINFELTGSIHDPQFREVDRRSRDIKVAGDKEKVVETPKEGRSDKQQNPTEQPKHKFNQQSQPLDDQGDGISSLGVTFGVLSRNRALKPVEAHSYG